jgi:hypothetical protein
MSDFEPYIEWEAMSAEQARAFASALNKWQEASEKLKGGPTPKRAAKAMQAQGELQNVADEIQRDLFRVPAMVHIAGVKEEEVSEDEEDHMHDHTHIVQRCKRCKSLIGFYCENQGIPEEEIPWWDEDTVVAKATNGPFMDLYSIEGRNLHSHEHECVGFES